MFLHFQSNLAHPVLKYMTSENSCQLLDTTLITADGEVECHAAVVLARMKFLAVDNEKNQSYCVILPDFTKDIVEEMLSFCYTGRAPRKHEEVSSLLVALNISKGLTKPVAVTSMPPAVVASMPPAVVASKPAAATFKPPAVDASKPPAAATFKPPAFASKQAAVTSKPPTGASVGSKPPVIVNQLQAGTKHLAPVENGSDVARHLPSVAKQTMPVVVAKLSSKGINECSANAKVSSSVISLSSDDDQELGNDGDVSDEFSENNEFDINSYTVKELQSIKKVENSYISESIGGIKANPSNNVKMVKVLLPKSCNGKHPMKSASFKCDYCDKCFNHKGTMLRHVSEVHLAGFQMQMFVCDKCNSVFSRKDSLDRHHLKNTCIKNKVPSFNNECKNCKKPFENPNKLKEHVRKNCTKKFFCNSCLKFFKLKKDLLSHGH